MDGQLPPDLMADFDRATTLAQTIVRDAAARINEEWPDKSQQNAAATLVFGFLAGAGEGMLADAMKAGVPKMFSLLFGHAKAMGFLIRASEEVKDAFLNGVEP